MIDLSNTKFTHNSILYKDEYITKEEIKKIISDKLNISDDYAIFFNNSLYELYNLVIDSIIKSFTKVTQKPNIICNYMEHPYILEILDKYKNMGKITITFIRSNIYGSIISDDIKKQIKSKKTCLIINSFINQSTGTINNLDIICEIAHNYKIPVFCDYDSAFGILPINPKKYLDIFSINLDYPGLYILIIKKNLIDGYKLFDHSIKFQKNNEQYDILDDYTYGIAKNVITQLYKSDSNRKLMNKRILNIKKNFIALLQKEAGKHNKNVYYYDNIVKNAITPIIGDIIIFGSSDENIQVPHILSLIIVKKNLHKIKKKINTAQINTNLFENLGIINKYFSNILTLGFSLKITKSDINRFVSFIF